MTAWTAGLASAPKDKMLMVDIGNWPCPAFMRWAPPDGDHDGFWMFCEELLSDASEPLEAGDIAAAKWALVPE